MDKFLVIKTKKKNRSVATESTRNAIPALASRNGSLLTDHAAKEEIIFQSFKERLGTSKHP
jgi:hypothetical protein